MDAPPASVLARLCVVLPATCAKKHSVSVARCFGGSIVGAYAREGGMGEFSSLLVLFVESSRHGDRLSVLHARQQPLGPRRQGPRLDARGAPPLSRGRFNSRLFRYLFGTLDLRSEFQRPKR